MDTSPSLPRRIRRLARGMADAFQAAMDEDQDDDDEIILLDTPVFDASELVEFEIEDSVDDDDEVILLDVERLHDEDLLDVA